MIILEPVHICDVCGKPIDVGGELADVELCISCGMELIKNKLNDGCSLWANNVCVLENK